MACVTSPSCDSFLRQDQEAVVAWNDKLCVSFVSIGRAPDATELEGLRSGAPHCAWPPAPWIRRGASTQLLA